MSKQVQFVDDEETVEKDVVERFEEEEEKKLDGLDDEEEGSSELIDEDKNSEDDPNRQGKDDNEDSEEVVAGEFDFETEGKKRGYKALFKEIEHLRKDKSSYKDNFEELKQQIQSLKEMPASRTQEDVADKVLKLENLQDGLEELKEIGITDKATKVIAKMMEIVSKESIKEALKPFESEIGANNYTKTLDKLAKKDERYKADISLYKDDIEDKLTELKIPKNLWADEKTLKVVLGLLKIEKPKTVKKTVKKVVKKSPSENKGSGGGGRGVAGGITVKELNDYAMQIGADLSDDAERQSTIAALRAKKKAQE